MSDDGAGATPSLEEIYALIDKDRSAAAKAAQIRFHNDMEAAIATIASIGSIAGARVLADSRVASASVLINAELAATRLLAEAERQASACVREALTTPKEQAQAALLEIGRHTTAQLIASAQQSVEKIQQDAEAAIALLQQTGAIAIQEIQDLAVTVSEQAIRDAQMAAEKLTQYRKAAHTPREAVTDGEDVARIVVEAARDASRRLQDVIKATLADINRLTNEACDTVRESARAAERNIQDGHDRAVARLREVLQAFR